MADKWSHRWRSRVCSVFLRNDPWAGRSNTHRNWDLKKNDKKKRKGKRKWHANRSACSACRGSKPVFTSPKLHTNWHIFGPTGLRVVSFKGKKHHALHTAHTRVTYGTRAPSWMTMYLKLVPAEKRQEFCGEPCSSKGMNKYAHCLSIKIKNKKMGKTKCKRRTEKNKKNACLPGLELASSNSKLHPSYLGRRSVVIHYIHYKLP